MVLFVGCLLYISLVAEVGLKPTQNVNNKSCSAVCVGQKLRDTECQVRKVFINKAMVNLVKFINDHDELTNLEGYLAMTLVL